MKHFMIRAAACALSLSASAAILHAESGDALAEAEALLVGLAEAGGTPFSPDTATAYTEAQNVFIPSAIAVDFTYRAASATMPLFVGAGPNGEEVHYIITEASDHAVAETLGVIYAPKMRHLDGHPGAQAVTIEDGVMQFRGNVDFSPEWIAVPGDPVAFPPAEIQAGAVADMEWSSMVYLPSGVVLNAQMVQNASGGHDRLVDIDLDARTATMSLLDGFQGGEQYYYHFVTDASEEIAAVLEQGVWAPRLALIDTFGQSDPSQASALLGFSPVLNGPTELGEEQGFIVSLENGGIDPINVFPIDPDNANASLNNNYSPLWDAHVSQWTEAAIEAGEVRQITSFEELGQLTEAGLIESAFVSPEGEGNPYVFGLRPTRIIINCPVIAQPMAEAIEFAQMSE
ncbi:MAG: hypothetical protein AAFO80_06560 [Pseudomonadota bacterium]